MLYLERVLVKYLLGKNHLQTYQIKLVSMELHHFTIFGAWLFPAHKKWNFFITLQWCRNRGGQGGHWLPQYLADQLTLFQPLGSGSVHPLLVAPQMFFTFRHQCRSVDLETKLLSRNFSQKTNKSWSVGKEKQSLNSMETNFIPK